MIVYKAIELPEREFSTKEDMFKALLDNKENIIELKKAEVRESDSLTITPVASKGLNMKDGYVYPVINTTLLMDSHNDVHADGIWNASLKQQQGKIFYLADHKLETTSVIAFPKDVKVMVKSMTWQELGYDYSGQTQALIFEVDKSKIRMQMAKDIINERIPIEHSVRMQYVKLDLAVDSEDPDFKREKSLWNKHINKIVNKEVAQERGYFWWVSEAKLFREGSMVLLGSNHATPMLLPEQKSDPEASSQEDPSNDSLKESRRRQQLLTKTKF